MLFDILLAINDDDLSVLVLMDGVAACEVVDHYILLTTIS